MPSLQPIAGSTTGRRAWARRARRSLSVESGTAIVNGRGGAGEAASVFMASLPERVAGGVTGKTMYEGYCNVVTCQRQFDGYGPRSGGMRMAKAEEGRSGVTGR